MHKVKKYIYSIIMIQILEESSDLTVLAIEDLFLLYIIKMTLF